MHVFRRLWAWCRAVDAAMERAEYRPPTPAANGVVLSIAMAIVIVMALAIADLARSVLFPIFFTIAFACFWSALGLVGLARYHRWLESDRRKNGQCVRCGFDLRYNAEHCPECGLAITDADRKHMTVTFTAAEAGSVTESSFVKIWIASDDPRHLLSLQRSTGADDPQIYMVFDLEPHSTPGQIASCSIVDGTLHLDLTGYFDNRYDHFQIALLLSPSDREALVRGLEDLLPDARSSTFDESAPSPE